MSLTDNVDGRTAWHRLAHATDNGGDTPLGIQTARKFSAGERFVTTYRIAVEPAEIV